MSGFLSTGAHGAHGAAHGLALATLASWLATEAFGAYMLLTWFASGGPRRHREQPNETPPAVILGHAALALTGFALWVGFVVAGTAAVSWVSIGFLAPAIGLGISTVTVWTPYPAHRDPPGLPDPLAGPEPGGASGPGPGGADGPGPGGADGPGTATGAPGTARPPPHQPPRPGHPDDEWPTGMLTDEMLTRALADEALTRQLVDDLLASMLADRPPPRRHRGWDLAPLVAIAHGISAVATFLLALLAAIAATAAI